MMRPSGDVTLRGHCAQRPPGRPRKLRAGPPAPAVAAGSQPPGRNEPADRPGAMGDTVLGGVAGLAEGDAEVIAQERRIVAEAASTARLDQRSETLAMSVDRVGQRSAEGDGADVAHPPAALCAAVNLLDEAAQSLLVGGLVAEPPSRPRPRPATERVDLDAAVVRQRGGAERVADGGRLGQGVLRVRLAGSTRS